MITRRVLVMTYFDGWKVNDLAALSAAAGRIIAAEGFQVNREKTRVMSLGRHQEVCGVTVNARAPCDSHPITRVVSIIVPEPSSFRAAARPASLCSSSLDGWR